MKEGEIIRCTYNDITYLDNLTEEEFLSSKHKAFTIRGRLAYYDSGIVYVVTEDEEKKELIAGYIIPRITILKGGIKKLYE